MSEVNSTNPPVEKYNRWNVIGPGQTPLYRSCRCDCGTLREVNIKNMRSGLSKSCGCHKREQRSKHGLSRSRTYNIYRGMFERTRNNLRYVQAGIKVCERWRGPKGFINFLADMKECPSDKHSLDRHPNRDGNYEPSNCRWATDVEQQRNQTRRKLYKWDGREQCASAWAEERNISLSVLSSRLGRGWTIHDALTVPIGVRRGPKSKILTPEEVAEIRRRYNKGSFTDGAPALGKEFGVSFQTIVRVVQGLIQRYNPPELELPDGEEPEPSGP